LLTIPLLGAAGLSFLLLRRLEPWKKQHSRRRGSKTNEANQQALAMRAAYDKMFADFGQSGLDMAAIESMRPWYHGLDVPGLMPWPKLYPQVTPPLPIDAVRLLVLPYEECPTLAATAAAAAADIAKLLSSGVPGIKIFLNARTNLHCTIFHTSHPSDLRPASSTAAGAGHVVAAPSDQGGQGKASNHTGSVQHPQPTQQQQQQQQQAPLRTATDFELQRENDLVARCVATAQPPRLKFERLVLAPSGVLLMTWTDPDGHIPALRSHLRETFPHASARQAKINDSSLLQIVMSSKRGQASIVEQRSFSSPFDVPSKCRQKSSTAPFYELSCPHSFLPFWCKPSRSVVTSGLASLQAKR